MGLWDLTCGGPASVHRAMVADPVHGPAEIEWRAWEEEPTPILRRRWRQVFGQPPPPSREFLLQTLAWQVQAQANGGLTQWTEAQLTRRDTLPPASSSAAALPLGTVLRRTYQGVPYTVTVDTQGYVFHERVYASLSEIARQITGTRWNGPAFFGLRSAKTLRKKKNASA